MQSRPRRTLTRRGVRAAQHGYFLLSFLLATALTSVVALRTLTLDLERQSIANGQIQGDVLTSIANAAHTYVSEQYTALQAGAPAVRNGTTVPAGAGVGQTRAPTIAQLNAMGYLTNFSATGVVNTGAYQIRIRAVPTGCVGAACDFEGLVYLDVPVTATGGALAQAQIGGIITRIGGNGGYSPAEVPANIVGFGWSTPNPVTGTPGGVVAARFGFGSSGLGQFVRISDSRDPSLQGPLTVAGPTTVNNNLTVGGTAAVTGDTSVGTCARILATTGRAGFGCADPNDLPAGYTGGVRTPDLVANGRILASDNPSAFTGANGNYVIAGVQGGVAEVRTSGRAAADRLTPLGQYAAGAACAAADEGSIARRSAGTGLVVCQASVWTALQTRANVGDACSPNGSSATSGTGVSLLCVNGQYVGMDTIIRSGTPGQACTAPGTTAIDTSNNNETLICRANLAGGAVRYMRLRDMTSHLAFVSALEVTDFTVSASGQVNKPSCNAGATQPATPIIQLIPKTFSSPNGGVALYAVDAGTRWRVFLRDGSGAVLTGSPNASAIAQIFCYFP
jgi:hypothetical protein